MADSWVLNIKGNLGHLWYTLMLFIERMLPESFHQAVLNQAHLDREGVSVKIPYTWKYMSEPQKGSRSEFSESGLT